MKLKELLEKATARPWANGDMEEIDDCYRAEVRPVPWEESGSLLVGESFGETGPQAMANSCLTAHAVNNLEPLLEAAKAAQCDCSPCLRESGHLIDCWFPALNQAIEAADKVESAE